MKNHNIHTHTTYSDGEFSPKKLIKIAKENKIEVLGISDHAFSDKLPEQYQITNKFKKYLKDLNNLKKSTEDLELKIGVEIDVSKKYGTKPSHLPIDILNNFDYLLFEYVNTENEYWGKVNGFDIREIAEIRNELKPFVGLAHNDLQKNFNGKELVEILKENDIFVEINQSEFHSSRGTGRNTRNKLNYYKHFSEKLLNELSKNKIKVAVGTDTHKKKYENFYELNKAYTFIEKNKLTPIEWVK